jgi:hypothetical protein
MDEMMAADPGAAITEKQGESWRRGGQWAWQWAQDGGRTIAETLRLLRQITHVRTSYESWGAPREAGVPTDADSRIP